MNNRPGVAEATTMFPVWKKLHSKNLQMIFNLDLITDMAIFLASIL